jgi:hypothetical protein
VSDAEIAAVRSLECFCHLCRYETCDSCREKADVFDQVYDEMMRLRAEAEQRKEDAFNEAVEASLHDGDE